SRRAHVYIRYPLIDALQICATKAAVALSNRMLINQLESLFESFISLINGAIDEKSPYTGGHCQRVPVLTMMLAEAVNETTEGPLDRKSTLLKISHVQTSFTD